MRKFLIKLLFKLLDEKESNLFELTALFDINSFSKRKSKKEFWRKGLKQAYKNKGLVDFLYYQSEADKEKVWRGKSNPDIVRGQRLRTLYLINEMRKAYEQDEPQVTKEGENRKKGLIQKLQQEFNKLTNL